jgi:hypothetical protein
MTWRNARFNVQESAYTSSRETVAVIATFQNGTSGPCRCPSHPKLQSSPSSDHKRRSDPAESPVNTTWLLTQLIEMISEWYRIRASNPLIAGQ